MAVQLLLALLEAAACLPDLGKHFVKDLSGLRRDPVWQLGMLELGNVSGALGPVGPDGNELFVLGPCSLRLPPRPAKPLHLLRCVLLLAHRPRVRGCDALCLVHRPYGLPQQFLQVVNLGTSPWFQQL